MVEPKLPVIIMTAFGTTEKPPLKRPKWAPSITSSNCSKSRKCWRSSNKGWKPAGSCAYSVAMDAVPEIDAKEAIIGRSKQMQEVYKAIGRVSGSDATVLIRANPAPARNAARAIYEHSLRSEKPFLVINCVAIPENLLEANCSATKKAPSPAAHRRVGKIEQANGPVAFLDEIGDFPFPSRPRSCVCSRKSIERLGGRDTIPVDDRRQHHRRHQPQLGKRHRGRPVSRRPLLPPQAGLDPAAAPAGRTRHSPADRRLPAPVFCRFGHGQSRHHPRGISTSGDPSLAGTASANSPTRSRRP